MASKVTCPICGCDKCHVRSVEVFQGNYATYVRHLWSAIDRMDAKPSAKVPYEIQVQMWCEETGHLFKRIFYFLDGQLWTNTIVEGEVIGDGNESEFVPTEFAIDCLGELWNPTGKK